MTEPSAEFVSQFSLHRADYLRGVDYINWHRYFYLLRGLLDCGAQSVLEVGVGDRLLASCVAPLVETCEVLDINPALEPDHVGDVREFRQELAGRFDAVVAADVLEHIPFSDLPNALDNLSRYLKPGGRLLITIPHRASHFLFMSPTNRPLSIRVPTGFLSFRAFYRRFVKRKIWIDPHHCWEIADGTVSLRLVNRVIRGCGLRVISFRKLLYVDHWVLSRDHA